MLIHYDPGKLLLIIYMYMCSFLLCVLLLGTSEISKNICTVLWIVILSSLWSLSVLLFIGYICFVLVYITQVNSAFCACYWLAQRWLAKYYSLPSRRRKTKWLPVSNKVILKQVKLLFGPPVIQLVWYILKQLFTSVSVKVVDIYLHIGK